MLLSVRLEGAHVCEQTCMLIVDSAVTSLFGRFCNTSYTLLRYEAVTGNAVLEVTPDSSRVQAAVALFTAFEGRACKVAVVAECPTLLGLLSQ